MFLSIHVPLAQKGCHPITKVQHLFDKCKNFSVIRYFFSKSVNRVTNWQGEKQKCGKVNIKICKYEEKVVTL